MHVCIVRIAKTVHIDDELEDIYNYTLNTSNGEINSYLPSRADARIRPRDGIDRVIHRTARNVLYGERHRHRTTSAGAPNGHREDDILAATKPTCAGATERQNLQRPRCSPERSLRTQAISHCRAVQVLPNDASNKARLLQQICDG